MTKYVGKIMLWNSKRLLRKLQKILKGYFFAAPCIFIWMFTVACCLVVGLGLGLGLGLDLLSDWWVVMHATRTLNAAVHAKHRSAL